jgi:hypothetical protein
MKPNLPGARRYLSYLTGATTLNVARPTANPKNMWDKSSIF